MPKFDIISANMYGKFLETTPPNATNSNLIDVKMFKECESILVCSGDYKPEWDATLNYFVSINVRDVEIASSKPDFVMANLKEALTFILKQIKK